MDRISRRQSSTNCTYMMASQGSHPNLGQVDTTKVDVDDEYLLRSSVHCSHAYTTTHRYIYMRTLYMHASVDIHHRALMHIDALMSYKRNSISMCFCHHWVSGWSIDRFRFCDYLFDQANAAALGAPVIGTGVIGWEFPTPRYKTI